MYEQQRQLVDSVVKQMEICADMIGSRNESKAEQYGFVPGLDENEIAKSLRTRIDSIKNGIFQVMFTGCFSSGKSTLINALIKRDVLRTGATPETAVITKIFFNADEEKVIIYKRDKVDADGQPSTEKMYDLEDFFEEYHVDDNDHEKFLSTVNHVELFLKTNGIAGSMVQFVDSPGTQASLADDEISKRFIGHADAVIFLISADAAMNQYDREFITEHFSNKQMRNVFFVVNKFNLLNTEKDKQKVRDRIRNELQEVFIDGNGNFNQELFDRRVFYVNAYGSLNTRIGKETNLGFASIMISDEQTGVPQFEEVLGEFLTSDDKDKVALSAYRPQMASIFVAAENAMKKQRDALNRGITDNKDVITAYENDKDEIECEINGIRKAIEDTERAILRDAKDAYDNFLTAINDNWDAYFADKQKDMQISYFSLVAAHAMKIIAFWRSPDVRKLECDEATKKATQGFADGIEGFLDERANDLAREIAFKIKNNIAQLMTDLEARQSRLEKLNMPINVEEIVEKIMLERNIPITGANPNLGQAFVALFFADPELIGVAGSGNVNTTDFIVKVLKVNLVDMILGSVLFAIIGNIFAIILFAFYKIYRVIVGNEDRTQKLIAETKTTILEGYKDKHGNFVCDDKTGEPVFTGLRGEHKATYITKVSALIHGIMRRTGGKIIDSINNNLAEVESNLSKINELLDNDERALQRETVRFNKVRRSIATAISEISRLTEGTTLTEEEIRKLAVNS